MMTFRRSTKPPHSTVVQSAIRAVHRPARCTRWRIAAPLVACLSISIGTAIPLGAQVTGWMGQGGLTTSGAQQGLESVRGAFSIALASPDASDAFDAERVRVRSEPVASALPVIVVAEGVPIQTLAERLTRIKAAVLAGMQQPQLEALRAYMEYAFPSLDRNVPVVGEWKGKQCTTPAFARELQQRVKALLTSLQRKGESGMLLVDLDLRSVPAGARVSLQAKGGGTVYRTVTAGTLRLFRGLYTYTAQQDGFDTDTSDLDLVSQPGTRLQCALRPTPAPSAPGISATPAGTSTGTCALVASDSQ
jgi:hypothetical protein